MKTKHTIWMYTLIAMGSVLMLINSCKKEESAKKDPIINWENPVDISYGSLLSVTQLNATSDVEGSFIYTPTIGTKLNIGTNQDLKVDFTPVDAATFNSISKTVRINVTAPIIVSDIDGNDYHTITIGTQTWMVENLKVIRFRNGDIIPNLADEVLWRESSGSAYCNYENSSSNGNTYGRLYNYSAVTDSRNIAPNGWHVATDSDWTTLIDFLGGDYVAGDKLKEVGTAHWASAYNTATNQSGFTALPGGYRNDWGIFTEISYTGYWWSPDVNSYYSKRKAMAYAMSMITDGNSTSRYGYSVRCVKD